jgi:hypothetical protein
MPPERSVAVMFRESKPARGLFRNFAFCGGGPGCIKEVTGARTGDSRQRVDVSSPRLTWWTRSVDAPRPPEEAGDAAGGGDLYDAPGREDGGDGCAVRFPLVVRLDAGDDVRTGRDAVSEGVEAGDDGAFRTRIATLLVVGGAVLPTRSGAVTLRA